MPHCHIDGKRSHALSDADEALLIIPGCNVSILPPNKRNIDV